MKKRWEKGNQVFSLQNASRVETYSAISLGLQKKKEATKIKKGLLKGLKY
jgi:hypothetical protein